VLWTYQLSYTLQRTDYDENGIGGWIVINVPLDLCVNGPFFLIAQFTGWDGIGQAPQLPWHYHAAGVTNPTERAITGFLCRRWLFLLAAGRLRYRLWLCDSASRILGLLPGAVTMYVAGKLVLRAIRWPALRCRTTILAMMPATRSW